MEGHGYQYERIDGNITGQMRQDSIDRFNGAFTFRSSCRLFYIAGVWLMCVSNCILAETVVVN